MQGCAAKVTLNSQPRVWQHPKTANALADGAAIQQANRAQTHTIMCQNTHAHSNKKTPAVDENARSKHTCYWSDNKTVRADQPLVPPIVCSTRLPAAAGNSCAQSTPPQPLRKRIPCSHSSKHYNTQAGTPTGVMITPGATHCCVTRVNDVQVSKDLSAHTQHAVTAGCIWGQGTCLCPAQCSRSSTSAYT